MIFQMHLNEFSAWPPNIWRYLIMKKLHEKITCFYEWDGPSWLVPDLTFRQYVELLRLCYEDKGKTGELEVWVNAEEKQKQHV